MNSDCPNGCDSKELKYLQKEVTLSAYRLTAEGGGLTIDWMTHLSDYADYYETDDDQMFLACAGCLTMRRVRLGAGDRIVKICSELLPDP